MCVCVLHGCVRMCVSVETRAGHVFFSITCYFLVLLETHWGGCLASHDLSELTCPSPAVLEAVVTGTLAMLFISGHWGFDLTSHFSCFCPSSHPSTWEGGNSPAQCLQVEK